MFRVVFHAKFNKDIITNTSSQFDTWEEANEYLEFLVGYLPIYYGGSVEFQQETFGWVECNENPGE